MTRKYKMPFILWIPLIILLLVIAVSVVKEELKPDVIYPQDTIDFNDLAEDPNIELEWDSHAEISGIDIESNDINICDSNWLPENVVFFSDKADIVFHVEGNQVVADVTKEKFVEIFPSILYNLLTDGKEPNFPVEIRWAEPNEPNLAEIEDTTVIDPNSITLLYTGPTLKSSIYYPIVITCENGKEVRIELAGDEVKITGACEEGAKIFFEELLKPLVDDYIRDKLKND